MKMLHGIVLITGLLTACSPSSKKEDADENKNTSEGSQANSKTDAETNSKASIIQSITDIYGGTTKVTLENSDQSENDEKSYFLEISESQWLNDHTEDLQFTSSKIAHIFHSNLLTPEEKEKDLRINIILSDKTTHNFTYSAETMKLAEELILVFEDASKQIQNQDYQGLHTLFDKEVANQVSLEVLREFCMPNDSVYGAVQETIFEGFIFINKKDNKGSKISLAQIVGSMKREKNTTPISLFMKRETKKLVALKYEF